MNYEDLFQFGSYLGMDEAFADYTGRLRQALNRRIVGFRLVVVSP